MSKTVIVIGGGAAGFFCAVTAARLNPDCRVIIVEKTAKLLAKVKVSGGGRCNVTHACFSIPEMIRKYPRGMHFLKKTFHQFFTSDTIRWFEERGVKLKTEADNRMFPLSNSSQTIIDCLMNEAGQWGVNILLHKEVRSIAIKEDQQSFKLLFSDGASMDADFVCIASGGYPKSSMFEWLKELGHSIEEPVPSLFTFNLQRNPITSLMGISVPDAQVKIAGSILTEIGPVLITHWGLSGPAILRLSAWGARELSDKNYDFSISVNWLPAYHEQSLNQYFSEIRFEMASQKIVNKNPFGLPQRLWDHFLEQAGISDIRWADLPSASQRKLVKICTAQEFSIKGKTTFKEEFVTAGGIKLAEIDSNTMQSKLVANLFFAGEVMDVDGITGGFNFQHAWTSGFVAGKSIARSAGES